MDCAGSGSRDPFSAPATASRRALRQPIESVQRMPWPLHRSPRPLFLGHGRRRRQSGRRRMPLPVWFPSGARLGNPVAFFLSRTTNTLSNQQLEWFVLTMSTTAPQYCPGRLWIARARTAALHVPYPDTRLCVAEPTRCPECGACFVPRTGSGNADDWQKGWLAPLLIGFSACPPGMGTWLPIF